MPVSYAEMKSLVLGAAIALGVLLQCGGAQAQSRETAVVAGGCFWCVEADFEKVRGVTGAVSGYTGGRTASPTYKEVSRGGTGHYEAVAITYDPSRVSYDQILHLFLRSIDPFDAGGQFCDKGESYRTAIFVDGPDQRAAAERAVAQAERDLGRKIVVPILDRARFHEAEDYHQDYYKKSEIVLTRRGPKSKAAAYKFYRDACGRDQRVRQIWGKAAPFAKAGS